MTLCEAEQEQRSLEVEMRRERENNNYWKQLRERDPAAEREYQKSRARLATLRGEYKELGEVLAPKAIRMKWDRSYVPRGSTGNPEIQPFFRTDIGVGAMATRFYVKTGMKTENDRWHVKEGSYVTGVNAIAKGSRIDDIDRLVRTYRLPNGSLTNSADWYKVRGTGIITDSIIEHKVELHWYQCINIGKVEMKVKRYYK